VCVVSMVGSVENVQWLRRTRVAVAGASGVEDGMVTGGLVAEVSFRSHNSVCQRRSRVGS
jgi:hypothetical protein